MDFHSHLSPLPAVANTIPLLRWRYARRLHLLPLVLVGMIAPGALGQTPLAMGVNTPGLNNPDCRTMDLPMVYTITVIVALGTFMSIYLVKRCLTKEGWSLANALSEPTRLIVPDEMRWTESLGDKESMATGAAATRKILRGSDGSPIAMTLLEASSSRMLATLGGLAILMLYMGYGIFALYSFGLTCQMPATMPAVTSFLLSGLSLFAPYVANKISTAIQPNIRNASRGNPAPGSPDKPYAAAAPDRRVLPSTTLGPPPIPPPPARSELISAPDHRPASSQPLLAEERLTPLSRGHRQIKTKPELTVEKESAIWSQVYVPALDLIRKFEGFVDVAYPDPASGGEPWTVGYGFITLYGRAVQPGQTISQQEADAELQRQAEACANHLAETIPYWSSMNANRRCALLDFAWNLGSDFYGDEVNFTSITRDLQNHDWAQVPQTLLLYCDPGSSDEAGLRRRRQAEANLWTTQADVPRTYTPSYAAEPSVRSAGVHSSTRFKNPLEVPYCDQLDIADGQGWRECFSASSAMLAMYWGKEINENVYDKLRGRYGNSTTSEAQLDALRSLGLTADFQTNGTSILLKQELEAGRPVAVGWLCDGPVSAPRGGGHWSVIIGYDDTGFYINDPYGNCDLVDGGYRSHHDGAKLHYSYHNWVPRWRVEGTGGWMLTCRP